VVKELALQAHLAGHSFPYDYGILIIIGGFISATGVLAYLFVEEPPARHVAKATPLRRQFADGFAMLKSLPDYRSFLWMRIFYQLTAMCFSVLRHVRVHAARVLAGERGRVRFHLARRRSAVESGGGARCSTTGDIALCSCGRRA
jgi:hypothetical protein